MSRSEGLLKDRNDHGTCEKPETLGLWPLAILLSENYFLSSGMTIFINLSPGKALMR
jgi:hypothetical protein